MIKNVKGNLLECDANIIVHCCNAFNTMGAGIALQIAKKYPEACEADKKTISGDRGKLGTISLAQTKDKKIIINLYGQFDIGTQKRQLNYEAFYTGLEECRRRIDALYTNAAKMKKLKLKKVVVGFPFGIGCLRAGGDWCVVHTMIQSCFAEAPYDVLIVEFSDK